MHAGLLAGIIESELKKHFDTMPIITSTFYSLFKNQGKKYIDALLEKQPFDQGMQTINNTKWGFYVQKYEAIGMK